MEKSAISKIWNFLWKDNSVWSWIVSLILAFIIVKFIFFPLLSFVFATPLPLVVVESGSMHHSGFLGNTFGTSADFEFWWTEHSAWYLERGINKEKALAWPIHNGMEIGDIIVISGRGKINVGDVIVFNAGQSHPVIHRVIEIKNINNTIYYSTKGDNNPNQLSVEKEIPSSSVLGKSLFRIPKIGWIKLVFTKIF